MFFGSFIGFTQIEKMIQSNFLSKLKKVVYKIKRLRIYYVCKQTLKKALGIRSRLFKIN